MPITILTTLSILLLAAHNLRFGETGIAMALLLFTALLWTRRDWLRIASIAVLSWGLFTWTRTLITLLQFRIAADLPWIRLCLILGTVMGITVLCILGLTSQKTRAFFNRGRDHAQPQAFTALLTAGFLFFIRETASMTMLLADRFIPGSGPVEIIALTVYASWVCGHLLNPKTQAGTRRRVWLLFSIVFFGQFFLGIAGIDQCLMTGILHLPVPALIVAGPLFRGEGFFMPILFASTLLLVGPAWCSHLCYIGAWDNTMAIKTRPGDIPIWAPVLRWSILFFVVLTALGLRLLHVPTLTALIMAGMFGLAGIGVMVFISRKRGRMVHCTVFCPIGILSNYLGKIAPWRIRISSACTGCTACLPTCRYNALDMEALAQGKPHITCTLCGDCVSSCKHGALTYSAPLLGSDMARTVFLIIVTTLHTVFLAVARI
jgi:ferredoxin